MKILQTLKSLYDSRGEEVEAWLAKKRGSGTPFLTTSVDLRHSGLRLAPVDTNLFPAGFNNLSPRAKARATRFIAHFLSEHYPSAKRIAIIPENHTRNLPYLENLSVLMGLFETLGLEVELGSLAASDAAIELETLGGRQLIQQPLKRDGNRLALANGYDPEIIIMNNDMTSGAPQILSEIAQPIIPPTGMGWYRRRKSTHFAEYKKLSEEFAHAFGLDPWLLAADFHACGMVDFKSGNGLECVATSIDKLLAHAGEKHREYGIEREPYVFVKADSGTYGMGIMTVKSGAEVLELNKKARNKMNIIKEGAQVSEVIIQKGIATIDTVDGKPAEPMVYMIDGVPVGDMWRVNGQRDAENNLNATGMEFSGMCDETEDECGEYKAVNDCNFRSFGLIAALAALAAAREEYAN